MNQPIGRVQISAAAIRQQVLARGPASFSNSVGKRQRDESGRGCRHIACGVFAGLGSPAPRQPSHVLRPPGTIAAKVQETLIEIGIVSAETTLDKQRGDFGGLECPGFHDHAGQTRRQGKSAQAASKGRDPSFGIDGADGLQIIAGAGDGRCGRHVEPCQHGRVCNAPVREVEKEAGQIGGANLGFGVRSQTCRLRFVPEAITYARLRSPGAAPPLVGGGPRYANGLKARDTCVRLISRHTLQSAIDHDAHAFDRQRGFGDGGRQNDLALTGGRGFHSAVLGGGFHRTIKRSDEDSRIRNGIAQALFHTADFALSRQEDEQRSGLCPECLQDGLRHSLFEPSQTVAAKVEGFDGVGAALAFDDRCAVKQRRDASAVQGGRHHHYSQIRTQSLLRIERQGKAEVGVHGAFVEFVEQDRADARQCGIVENHPRENAFGYDLDACSRSAFRDHTGAQTYGVSHTLPQRSGHSLRRATGSYPARLKDQDFPIFEPGRFEKGKRNAGRLASAGRRHQHGRISFR